MDYSWLDRLPRIEKEKIPEPVKYWALYAKSFYENFLALIDNPRRLKKATVRMLEKLNTPEEKDALLFFFRIRRDELDGINLWESLKSKYAKMLKESPDMIEADNLSIIRPGTPTLGTEEFQFPFGYYNGTMRIGKLRGIHPDIYNLYPDMEGFKGRMSMEYAGRVWINDRIISFWDYPPTKEKLIEIIRDIEEEFREKYKKPLYINENDWYIEIIDKKLSRKKFNDSSWGDWDQAENATLIKIKDYTGSGEWSIELRSGPHIAVPAKTGFGSRHPKYQSTQKMKRYMWAENLVPSFKEFLNEDMGNLKKFNLPNQIIRRMTSSGGWGSAGRDSEVEIIEVPKDPKKFSSVLKTDFRGGVITVDGIPKYFFKRESERKFELYDLDSIRKYEDDEYKRKKERKERERQRELERQNENLNERGYHNYQPGLKGSYSGQGLSEFIQGLDGDVTVELIRGDKKRGETQKERSKARQENPDPLKPGDIGWSHSSLSQQQRYKRYSTKKRLGIDKKVDDEKEKLKKSVMDNFDSVLDDIIDDLRKGYAWKANKEDIGKSLLNGIDISSFARLAKAYDAVEPKSGASGQDAAKASRVLKQTGYL